MPSTDPSPKPSLLLQVMVIALLAIVFIYLQSRLFGDEPPPPVIERVTLGNHQFFDGNYSQAAIIGNSLPGTWRPFADDSPWNTPIAPDAPLHPDSDLIVFAMNREATNLNLIKRFLCPIWVVNSANIPGARVRSDRIYDSWDADDDGWSDMPVPVTREMWGEPTADGQICIVDPFRMLLWDLSSYSWIERGGEVYPRSTTLDVWDLRGSGTDHPPEGTRWVLRGGRGSGFPALAGLIRPEELAAGEIRHALCFSFPRNRLDISGAPIFLPPACRSDGTETGRQFPIEGMLFQLDPELTEADLAAWGLTREGKIVARALQRYGMYLGLTGGPMKLEVQLLGPTESANRQEWDRRFPGFYDSVRRIPTREFRVVYTGEPTVRPWVGKLKPNAAFGEP